MDAFRWPLVLIESTAYQIGVFRQGFQTPKSGLIKCMALYFCQNSGFVFNIQVSF